MTKFYQAPLRPLTDRIQRKLRQRRRCLIAVDGHLLVIQMCSVLSAMALRQSQLSSVACQIHIHRLRQRLTVIDLKDHEVSDTLAYMTGAKAVELHSI